MIYSRGGQATARWPHAARDTISRGPPEHAETSTYVEFYETVTVFIKTGNFMKIVCVSVLTITAKIALNAPSVKYKNCL